MASPEIFDIPIGNVVGPKGDTGNGIESIELLSTSGLNKTYRITMTDGTTFDFVVTDGNRISRIEKTGTSGLVDTYTVTYTNGQTFTYTVTNGADGVSPSVTVTEITGGHRVEIEDAEGTHSFNVMDGEDGASDAGEVTYDDTDTYPSGSVGGALNHLKTALSYFDDIPGTVQTVNFDSAGNPSSIVHTANGATVRTDAFVWGANTVTETRTLADGRYITFVTDLTTLVTTISEIQEAS